MQSNVLGLLRAALPNVGHVLVRFPWASAASIALTAFLLLELYNDEQLPVAFRNRLPIALVGVFFWSVTAAFLCWRLKLTAVRSALLTGAGVAIIAAAIGYTDALDLRPPLLILALVISIGLVSHARRPDEAASFWYFNHDLWISALAAILTGLVFAAGVSSILFALRYLFGVPIEIEHHHKVGIVALWLVAPLNWLSLVPGPGEQPDAINERRPTHRAVVLLVSYVLVPLLLTYAAILHAYAIKILIDGSLPKGRLGWMVLTYGTTLAMTALLTFPTRERSGPLVHLFWRIWPWLLPVPLVLLFIAVSERLEQYGLTEGRYLVLLVGVWLGSLVLTQGFAIERRDLRLIPGVLVLLLTLSAAGPWGMLGLSTNMQANELVARLTSAGVLKEGRGPPEARPTVTILESDRRRVQDIITYLAHRGRLTLLKPLFEGHPNDPFAVPPPAQEIDQRAARSVLRVIGWNTRDSFRLASDVGERLGLPRAPFAGLRTAQRYFSLNYREPRAVVLQGGRVLLGVFHLSTATGGPHSQDVQGGAFKVAHDQGEVIVTHTESGKLARFGLAQNFRARFAAGSQNTDGEKAPLVFAPDSGDLAAELILVNADGLRSDDAVRLSTASYWLLIGEN